MQKSCLNPVIGLLVLCLGGSFSARAQGTRIVHAFGVNGYVGGPLTLVSNSIFGGYAVFRVESDGSGFGFVTNTFSSVGIAVSENVIYGVQDGAFGPLYRINLDGSGRTNLFTFSNTDGINPFPPTVADGAIYGVVRGSGFNDNGGLVYRISTNGSGFTIIHHFAIPGPTNTEGASPACILTVTNGMVYGTTTNAGPGNTGTVFSMDTNGLNFSILHAFGAFSGGSTSSDGAYPLGKLCIDGDVVYGTTCSGGAMGGGTVFSVNTSGGNFKTIHTFPTAPYAQPNAGPQSGVVLHKGVLYGVAQCYPAAYNGGVYRLNVDGSGFALIQQFEFSNYDPTLGMWTNRYGGDPYGEPAADDNNLYLSTHLYGRFGFGTVLAVPFSLPPVGTTVTGFARASNSATFGWNTIPKGTYQVQYATTTGATNWLDLGEPITAPNFTWSFMDTNASEPSRFYRVRVISEP
jgi:uncharacterized repeat protein (TIGR03803 family)